MRQASRIAANRVIAGVHFPVDGIAGRLLGVALADYFVASCGVGKYQWTPRTFDGTKISAGAADPDADAAKLDLHPECQQLNGTRAPFYAEGTAQTGAISPLLKHVWDKARDEWKEFGFTVAPRPCP